MKKKRVTTYEKAMTTAAVSAVFHQDDRYEAYYKKHADALGGFPGLWGLCVEAAAALDTVTEHLEDYEHIDAIDLLVDLIYRQDAVPDDKVMKELAMEAYTKNRYDHE